MEDNRISYNPLLVHSCYLPVYPVYVHRHCMNAVMVWKEGSHQIKILKSIESLIVLWLYILKPYRFLKLTLEDILFKMHIDWRWLLFVPGRKRGFILFREFVQISLAIGSRCIVRGLSSALPSDGPRSPWQLIRMYEPLLSITCVDMVLIFRDYLCVNLITGPLDLVWH